MFIKLALFISAVTPLLLAVQTLAVEIPEDGTIKLSGVVSNSVFVGDLTVTGKKAEVIARNLGLPKQSDIVQTSVIIDLTRNHVIEVGQYEAHKRLSSNTSNVAEMSVHLPFVPGQEGFVQVAWQGQEIVKGKAELEKVVGHSLGEFRILQLEEKGAFYKQLFDERATYYPMNGLMKVRRLYWEPTTRRVFRIDEPLIAFHEWTTQEHGLKKENTDLWASRRTVTVYEIPHSATVQNTTAKPAYSGSIKTLGYTFPSERTTPEEPTDVKINLFNQESLYLPWKDFPVAAETPPYVERTFVDGSKKKFPLLMLDISRVSESLRLSADGWVETSSAGADAKSNGVFEGYEIVNRFEGFKGFLLVRLNDRSIAIVDTNRKDPSQWVYKFEVPIDQNVFVHDANDAFVIEIPYQNQRYVFRKNFANLMSPTLDLQTYSAISATGIFCDGPMGSFGRAH